MKIHTDVTSLSRLYQLFKAAHLEGVLAGNYSQIEHLTFPDICAALLAQGQIPEICAIITRSEYYVADPSDSSAEPETKIPWEACSLQQCMGIIVPFLIDITVGPLEFNPMGNPVVLNQQETVL